MNRSKLSFLGAMVIFGTIGIFVKYIPLSSSVIAFARGLLGVLFLLGIMCMGGKKLDIPAIRKNLAVLCLSGVAIGFNWIALFESYKYATVATATVCYYLAPLFLLLASPLLGEKLTAKKVLSIAVALVGMVLVSGILEKQQPTDSQLTGIALGLGAALLYACVMFLNKKLSPIGAYDKTVVQLGTSAVVLLPYILLTQGAQIPALTAVQWVLLAVVGIVHTGIAYALYFGAMKDLKAGAVAIFSYLDPVIALVLSALILKEPMRVAGAVGSVLILGSALYSELPTKQ